MKITRLVKIYPQVFAITLAFGALNFAYAHDEDKHTSGQQESDSSPTEILQTIESQHKKLSEAVKTKHLEQVHESVFAIRDSARRLAQLSAKEKRARIEGTVANIAKLAARLDQSGDAGDQEESEAHLRKLDTLIRLLSEQAA